MKKEENCLSVSTCRGRQVGGGLYIKEENRPFAFRMFKEKRNLFLSGTVCVEVFQVRKAKEI